MNSSSVYQLGPKPMALNLTYIILQFVEKVNREFNFVPCFFKKTGQVCRRFAVDKFRQFLYDGDRDKWRNTFFQMGRFLCPIA